MFAPPLLSLLLILNIRTITGHQDVATGPVAVRLKRGSTSEQEICKYSKGTWSTCNVLTKLENRDDQLRTDVSSPGCPKIRQITRNCKKDKRQNALQGKKGGGPCVYDKAREGEWSECQSGVRQKSLNLVTGKENANCPKVKIIAKKCKMPKKKPEKKEKKDNKERRDKNDKKEKQNDRKDAKKINRDMKQDKKDNNISEKCDFGSWGEYTACKDGFETRQRQIIRGAELKSCQTQAQQRRKC